MRIEQLKAAYEIETKLVHFPLHPDTPMEGREMAGFYAQRGRDPEGDSRKQGNCQANQQNPPVDLHFRQAR